MQGSALVIVGSAIPFLGDISYIRDILKKQTQPNRVSWLMWGISTLLVAFDQVHQGVGMIAMFSFAIAIGDILVFSASFVRGKGIWRLSSFDIACGIASALGLLVWTLTDNDTVALCAFMAADVLATIPTLKKSWSSPESESIAPYAATVLSSILVLSAVQVWTSGAVAFSVWLLAINLLLIFFISSKIGRKLRPKKARALRV